MARILAYLRTLLVLIAAAGAAPAAGVALPQDERAQVRVFATCAGRMSAVVEFQWMFDGAASERSARVREGFLALLEASVGGAASPREALAWRIEAKMAQAQLLTLQTFGTDPRAARAAARASSLYLGECAGLLLG